LAKIKPGREATTKPINVQHMHTDNTHTHTQTFKANENTQTDNYNGKPNANKQ